MQPDLLSLRLLAGLARAGSIGAAGRTLGMSQQSASERLRRLEADLGVTLVARGPRGATLTDAGRLVVEWSADLLERADAFTQAAESLRAERTATLTVHASLTVAESVLPGVLVTFRRRHETRVTLHAANSETVVAAVRAGTADLGFIEGPVDTSGLRRVEVAGDELVLVAGPQDPWARRRSRLDAATLAARPLGSREPGSGTRRVWTEALRAAGADPAPPEIELDTTAALLASAAAGGPPVVVSRRAADAALRVGTLVEVATHGVDVRRTFSAVWAGGRLPPRGPARDLVSLVADAAGHRPTL